MVHNPYYDDIDLLSFESEVVSCECIEDEYHAILKESAFYVESGGMASDKGTLNGVNVERVYLKDNQIVHVLKEAISGNVHGEIDAIDRKRKCQIHSAQHVLSYLIERDYPLLTVSHHYDAVTSDICYELVNEKGEYQEMSDEVLHAIIDLDDLNQKANTLLATHVPFNIRYPSYEEYKDKAEEFGYTFNEGDSVRVVLIGENDYNFCGCIHVKYTSDIGMIVVHSVEKYKRGLRIIFNAGYNLAQEYIKRRSIMHRVSSILNCNEFNLEEGASKLNTLKVNAERDLNEARNQLMEVDIKEVLANPQSFYFIERSGYTQKEMQQFVSRVVTQNECVCAGLVHLGERCHVFISCSASVDFNCATTFKELAAKFELRGGGNPKMAQGGGIFTPAICETLEHLMN